MKPSGDGILANFEICVYEGYFVVIFNKALSLLVLGMSVMIPSDYSMER